jgi:hypothetical protein
VRAAALFGPDATLAPYEEALGGAGQARFETATAVISRAGEGSEVRQMTKTNPQRALRHCHKAGE